MGLSNHVKVMMTCVWPVMMTQKTITKASPCWGSKPAAGPVSEAQQGVNIYGHQISGGGLEWYADKVTGGEEVSVGVQCNCGCYWIKPFVVNKPILLVCTVHWVSVWSDSPGDYKDIANLPSSREWGTICNLFLYLNSWDHELLVYSVLQGYIPSVSMTSKSVNLFSFSSVHFPSSFKPLTFFLSSSFNSWPILNFAFSLKVLCLSSFFLLTC